MLEPDIDPLEQKLIREIAEQHGETLIGTLRKVYGANFGCGFRDNEPLSAVLRKLDERSLSDLIYYHKGGSLGMRIASG
jgi:hypothetical protein